MAAKEFPSLSFIKFLSKIPSNSSSLLDFAVRDTHNYCMEHSMRLNPKKMLVDDRELYGKSEHYNETPV